MKILTYKLSTALLLSILVVSIFLLFFTASISYKQFESVMNSEKMVIHSHLVHGSLQQLVNDLNDAETSQRGYLLTHDTIYLNSYNAARVKAEKDFAALRLLIRDNERQALNLDSLYKLATERIKALENSIRLSTYAMAVSDSLRESLLNGKEVMDKIHIHSNAMLSIEQDLLDNRQSKHEKEVRLSPLTFLLTAFFSLLVFVSAFYKIFRNLKKLQRANNRLRINEETFQYAEQIAQVSYWCWNMEANTLSYSANQYRLLGCEPHAFEPTVENFLEYVHPDDRHIILEGNEKAIESKSASRAYFRVIRKDGELRYFESVGKIITDNYGKSILIGINADITDQYIKDKILKDRLFDLERSNKELSAFNHVASHDLQEPLRKIQTFITRIADKDKETLSEKTREYFIRIHIAANRMQKLIDDLLSYSRANKAHKAFEPTDLNIIFEHSKQELAQMIEDKHAIVEASFLPTVHVVPFQIQQLFTNIIGNALKYSKTGVQPHVSISSVMILRKDIADASVGLERKFCKIIIADNGIGFEQQYADKIFTLFHRLHSDDEYSGTGIGLTICKKIVENHNGFITAHGILDKGATFNIFIPVD